MTGLAPITVIRWPTLPKHMSRRTHAERKADRVALRGLSSPTMPEPIPIDVKEREKLLEELRQNMKELEEIQAKWDAMYPGVPLEFPVKIPPKKE